MHKDNVIWYYQSQLGTNISPGDFVDQVEEGGMLPYVEDLYVLAFDGDIYQVIAWIDFEIIDDLYIEDDDF